MCRGVSQLHGFHVRLCRYVAFNICEWFKELPKNTRERQFHGELFDFLQALPSREEEQQELQEKDTSNVTAPYLFNSVEFLQLTDWAGAAIYDESFVPRPEPKWFSIPQWHCEARQCVREIRVELTRTDADEWTRRSRRFARNLERDGISLAAGIRLVDQWSTDITRYHRAIGRLDLVPRPYGSFPTPTTRNLDVRGPDPVDEMLSQLTTLAAEKNHAEYIKTIQAGLGKLTAPDDVERLAQHPAIAEYVASMRDAVKKFGDGLKVTALLSRARKEGGYKTNNQSARTALRILERLGQYHGFGEDKAGRNATRAAAGERAVRPHRKW